MSNTEQTQMIVEETRFSTTGNLTLCGQWYNPYGTPKGIVIIVHGLAEHCGRYEHVAHWLVARGYAVATADLRGHGRSEGHRILVNRFDDYVEDVDQVVADAVRRFPQAPLFLLGHSMGGTIALLYVLAGQTTTQDHSVRGIVLSGIALELGSDIPQFLQRIAALLGKLLPKLPTIKLRSAGLCSDPEIGVAYDNDPLVYRGGIPARTGAELTRAIGRIRAGLAQIQLPLLILHGALDPLVNPHGSEVIYQQAGSPDKTLKIYPGLCHEILNEPQRERVLADIVDWLDAHQSANAT